LSFFCFEHFVTDFSLCFTAKLGFCFFRTFIQMNQRLFSFALVACLFAISGCDSIKSGGKSTVEVAQVAVNKGDFAGAAIHYKNMVQANGDNHAARLGLGQTSLQLADFGLAQAELERVVKLPEFAEKAYPGLMETLALSNQYEKLLETSIAAAKQVPAKKALSDYYRGRALVGLKRPEEAMVAFDSALAAQPDLKIATVGKYALQFAAFSSKAPNAESEKLLDQILAFAKQAPDVADAQALAGYALRFHTKPNEASTLLAKAVELRPYDLSTRSAYAKVLIDLVQYPAAEAQVDALLKYRATGPNVTYLAGLLAFRQGNMARAQELIQSVLASNPNYAPALEIAAEVAVEGGEYVLAEKYSRALIAQVPNSTLGYRYLAATFLAVNSPERALTVLTPLIQSKVTSPDILALTGDALIRTGNQAKGIQFLEAANQAAGQAAGLSVALAKAKLQAGESGQAVQALDKATQISRSAQTDLNIARSYSAAREFTKAKALAQKYIAANPKDAQGPYVLGLVQLESGDGAEASKSMAAAITLNPNFLPAIDTAAQIDLASSTGLTTANANENAGYKAAKQRYEAFAKTNSNDYRPYIALARMAAKVASNDQEVLAHLATARKLAPIAPKPTIELGKYLTATSRPDQAIQEILNWSQKQPINTELLMVLVNAYQNTGQNPKAVAMVEEAIKSDGTSAALHFTAGKLRLAMNDFPGALGAFQRAAELQPEAIEPKVAVASTLFAGGKKAQAAEAMNAVRAQFASNPVVAALDGDFAMADAKTAEAVGHYTRAFAGNKSPQFASKLYSALVVAGKGDEARNHLKAYWNSNKDVEFMLAASEVLIRQSAWKDALGVLNEVLKVNPNSSAALNNAALAMHNLKEAKAVTLAEKAYAIDPHNFSIIDTYGVILSETGQAAKGLELLKLAAQKAPSNMQVKEHLAKAQSLAGQK
jgi:cellulose synthase operon protein C